jgi:Zn-dependent protease with chaperone function
VTVLQANYFDGRTTRLRVVDLSVSGAELTVSGGDIDFHLPFSAVGVDERLGRAPRRLRFPGGAFCEVRDLDALDALLKSMAYRDGWVDRMQRHLQAVIISTVVSILLSLAAYKWGLPWAAAEGARRMPPAVGRTLSVQAMKVLDGKFLLTSKIRGMRQQALSAQFNRLRLPEGGTPKSLLLFRASPQFGSNAFTLPDGTIILLDDLVTSIDDDRQIMAVLSHELGHARGHDSLQLLLESSAVGAFWTFYAGDISSLIAAAPAVLVKARYSQSLERTADEYGAALLARNDMSPRLLADALETVAKSRALPGSASVGYLSSHPSTDERLQRLRELAAAFEAK